DVDLATSNYVAVTATSDHTDVVVEPTKGVALPGTGIPRLDGNGATFQLDKGDTLHLLAEPGTELSGTRIHATSPIQILTGSGSLTVGAPAGNHVEESLLPISAWGNHYIVAAPTGPTGAPAVRLVRMTARTETSLSYLPSSFENCPAFLAADQVGE